MTFVPALDALKNVKVKPKRKRLEFKHLRFDYDYETGEFFIEDESGPVPYSQEEVAEILAALQIFGLDRDVRDEQQVHYRGEPR